MTERSRKLVPEMWVKPLAARRWSVRIHVAVFVAAALTVAASAALLRWVFTSGLPWWLGLAPPAVIYSVWTVGSFRFRRRLRRELDEHDWLLCPECNHDLRGLAGDPITCPECGHVWGKRQIRLSWERIVFRKREKGVWSNRDATEPVETEEEPSP